MVEWLEVRSISGATKDTCMSTALNRWTQGRSQEFVLRGYKF